MGITFRGLAPLQKERLQHHFNLRRIQFNFTSVYLHIERTIKERNIQCKTDGIKALLNVKLHIYNHDGAILKTKRTFSQKTNLAILTN